MKKLLPFLLLILFGKTLVGQWEQTNGPEGGSADDIVSIGSNLFVSVESGGIYMSSDNGNTWQSKNDGIPDNENVTALIENDGVLYIALTRQGIYKSENQAALWEPINTGIETTTFYSLFAEGDNIYAGNANGGITYSNNGGLSWNYSDGEETNFQISSFTTFNDKVYAGAGPSNGFLYESSDNGASWQSIVIPDLGPNGARTIFATADTFYVANEGNVFVSKDSLISFQKISIANSGASILNITSYLDKVYLTTSLGRYFFSENEGDSWTMVQNKNTDSFVRDLFFINSKIIMSTDEGLYESVDSGISWSLSNQGINAITIEALHSNATTIFAGSNTQGVFRSENNGETWTPINTGLDAANAKTVYEVIEVNDVIYMATGAGIYVWDADAETWSRSLDPGINRATPVLTYENGTFLTGPTLDGMGLYMSNDMTQTWLTISIDEMDNPTTFSALLNKGNVIVLATGDGELFISQDSGTTWSDISINLGGAFLTYDLEIFENKLYAATARGILVSDDFGVNWSYFKDMFLPTYDLEIEQNLMIAATGQGFYATNLAQDEWHPFNEGFGARSTSSVLLSGEDIFASPLGQSVWKFPKTQIDFPPLSKPFITTWKTDNSGTSGDNQIIIPIEPSLDYNYSVDWGDGTTSLGITGNATHDYSNPGTYTISIDGNFPAIFLANSGEEEKLLEVNQWGDIIWELFFGSFFNCKNLDITATDIPNLTQVEVFGSTFVGCESLVWNSSVGDWDMSGATSLLGLFSGANLFNQDISGWDVSNVTNMGAMFSRASSFDQDLKNWNVSKVTNMNGMFQYSNFNQDISNWDVSSVTDMDRMFWNATSYNQSMEKWDISQVSGFVSFLENSGLSNENYDKTLIGWSELPALQNEVQLDAPQNQYCLSESARQSIIDIYGWTINDLGLFCEDTTVPELTLIGDNPFVIIEGSIYNDPGAMAEDDVDGDITNNIIVGGDIVDSDIPGTYMVTYNVSDTAGNMAVELVRTVIVEMADPSELAVLGFSLVDAENDEVLFSITEGMVIYVNTLSTMSLSIIALVTDDAESVLLNLSGTKNVERTENVAPYALFGDVVPDYRGEVFDLGGYTISATPYSDNKLKGSAGIPLSLNFSIQEADPICTGFEITITNQQNPTTCSGNEGFIDFDVIGAALPVSYEMVDLVEAQSSSLFDGLSAGKYLVLVTDANNCSETLTVILEDPAIPEVTLEPFDTVLDTDASFQLTGGMPLGGVYSGVGVDDSGFFEPSLVGTGTYEITYTFIDSVTDCSNSATQSISVSSVNVNMVTGFVLVNAYTNTDIMALTEGLSIEISDLPTTNLNIRAETTEDVESALLQITGNLTNTRTENVAPYAFYGDINSNYFGKGFGEGDYTITATPYTDDKLSGEVGSGKTINFSINAFDGVPLKAMNIYPNPANVQARASFDNIENGIEKIMIFDMLGRLVQVYEAEKIKDGSSYLLNVHDISVGTYFIKTEDVQGNQYQKQMVIQR